MVIDPEIRVEHRQYVSQLPAENNGALRRAAIDDVEIMARREVLDQVEVFFTGAVSACQFVSGEILALRQRFGRLVLDPFLQLLVITTRPDTDGNGRNLRGVDRAGST